MATPPAIEFRQLSKRFGSFQALHPLDLAVPRGEVFGYLGPNGAGKTTTIRLLLGLLRPTAGTAFVFGHDALRDSRDVHAHLAYVPGEATLWPSLTGEETLELLGAMHGRVDEAYRGALVRRFNFDPDRKVRAYSKGNRQKLILIAALMTRAPVLVLDEPTAGLDPLMERVFQDCLREAKGRGQTVFLSSHVLSQVEAVCDRIGIIRAGRLVEVGSLQQMRHLARTTVEATTSRPVPDLLHVPGVSGLVVRGTRLECQVEGPMGPLLAALQPAGIVRFVSREPTLEELFMTHYGVDGGPGVR